MIGRVNNLLSHAVPSRVHLRCRPARRYVLYRPVRVDDGHRSSASGERRAHLAHRTHYPQPRSIGSTRERPATDPKQCSLPHARIARGSCRVCHTACGFSAAVSVSTSPTFARLTFWSGCDHGRLISRPAACVLLIFTSILITGPSFGTLLVPFKRVFP